VQFAVLFSLYAKKYKLHSSLQAHGRVEILLCVSAAQTNTAWQHTNQHPPSTAIAIAISAMLLLRYYRHMWTRAHFQFIINDNA
jgi:hypothetical protein